MIVLGIESSCDETAAAVVSSHRQVVSSVVASQIDAHRDFGGVVPELASRMHIEAIESVVEKAIVQAGISMADIQGVAATRGPGLLGALLVGFSFARAFAFARNLPLAGVNHLEAHIHSLFLTEPCPEFPFIALLVSGGHTNLYYVKSEHACELMGQTRDDAAGESFDKVARMLELGYPGGPVLERMARQADSDLIPFPRTLLEKDKFDFSFSGLKSAVLRYIQTHPPADEKDRARIAASFQASVIHVLTHKILQAARTRSCSRVAVCGGVAANSTLIQALKEKASRENIHVFAPPVSLCGDNAAMVAARGYVMIEKGQVCSLDDDVFSRIPR